MPDDQYQDLDLEIRPLGGGRYEAVAKAPKQREAPPVQFSAPFSEADADQIVSDVASWRREAREITSSGAEAVVPQSHGAIEGKLLAFGLKLFESVFQGEVGFLLASLINDVHQGDFEGLRIRLHLQQVPELAMLPWEYLCRPSNKRFIATSVKTPITRYYDTTDLIKPLAVKPPLRLLIVAASPEGEVPPGADEEIREIGKGVQALESANRLVVERLDPPTFERLQERLAGSSEASPVHLIHFIGHGVWDEVVGDGVLLFEDSDRRPRRVTATQLSVGLQDHDPLRMVILNACEGARGSRLDPFASLASRLIQQARVSAVMAMQFPITIRAAIDLAAVFYREVGRGAPVEAALAEGRKTLFGAAGGSIEWGTPVLHLRAPDGRLFDLSPETPEVVTTGAAPRGIPSGEAPAVTVANALNALAGLLQLPAVREETGAFRRAFESVRDNVARLGDYKDVHDKLHDLQFRVYDGLATQSASFPDAPGIVEVFDGYAQDLDELVENLSAIAARATFTADPMDWVRDLDGARQSLRAALDASDPAPLSQALKIMRRTLAVKPGQFNTLMFATARALGLDGLVAAMMKLRDRLDQIDARNVAAGIEAVEQFTSGVDAVSALAGKLTALVAAHGQWQEIDNELRMIEGQMGQDVSMLADLWPDLRRRVGHLAAASTEPWAERLRGDEKKLAEAIDGAAAPVQVKRFFMPYRRRIGTRFFEVDKELKCLCDSTRPIVEPLTRILDDLT